MFEDWRPRGPGSRKGGQREWRAHSGHPREPSGGVGHLGGPRRGELPDRRDERGEDSVLGDWRSTRREFRRSRGDQDVQPGGTMLQAYRGRGHVTERAQPQPEVHVAVPELVGEQREQRVVEQSAKWPRVRFLVGTVANAHHELVQGLA